MTPTEAADCSRRVHELWPGTNPGAAAWARELESVPFDEATNALFHAKRNGEESMTIPKFYAALKAWRRANPNEPEPCSACEGVGFISTWEPSRLGTGQEVSVSRPCLECSANHPINRGGHSGTDGAAR